MQNGHILRISGRWYIRYWERRKVNGQLEQKRVSHCLGPITTKGKKPPADIVNAAREHMASLTTSTIPAERIITLKEFVEGVYLPWVQQHRRPSTSKGCREIWEGHLQAHCASVWMKNTRTFHVQGWLNSIANDGLSRNTLKHIKSAISAIFKLAKQLDYFQGENPAKDTAVSPSAPAPQETYAYSLEEVNSILVHIPEPAATAFAVAAYTGLRMGEIEGLNWEDYRDGEIHVTRSVWNGHENAPKTRKSLAPVPVIRPLVQRLEMHRLRSMSKKKQQGATTECSSKNSLMGPMFTTSKGTRQNMNNFLSRAMLPALNRCEVCHKSEDEHAKADHKYKRDAAIPEWRGWHACRRGLGSNLYRLGVPDVVIQRILRHANVSTTTGYYIKTVADDVRNAMERLENSISQTEAVQ